MTEAQIHYLDQGMAPPKVQVAPRRKATWADVLARAEPVST